jgi:hypothetical protein
MAIEILRRRPMPSTPSTPGKTIRTWLNAMGAYIERYVYDAVGNFLQMQHRGSDPAHAGWTRSYDYLEASLIEDGSGGTLRKTSNRLSSTTVNPAGNSTQPEAYLHDAHGNMVRMPHLGVGAARAEHALGLQGPVASDRPGWRGRSLLRLRRLWPARAQGVVKK